MKEKELQQVWYDLATSIYQSTSIDGKIISVISPGVWNRDQGPDFLYAEIEIEGQCWHGHVEIHLKTSDWFRHGHHQDLNYANVILHVVMHHDMMEFEHCPILILNMEQLKAFNNQNDASLSKPFIDCPLNQFDLSKDGTNLLEHLAFQRFQSKSVTLLAETRCLEPDWELLLWLQFATAFGQKVNAETFRAMAQSIPVYLLKICQHDLFTLEALFLGQAGLLERESCVESYFIRLKNRHSELKTKYGLQQVFERCHFLRMRPMNFPTIRLAQLASFMYGKQSLKKYILDASTINDLEQVFHIEVSDFWKSHFTFRQKSRFTPKTLGVDMCNRLIINVCIPYLFVYSHWSGDQSHIIKAMDWGKRLPFECNSLTKRYDGKLRFERNAVSSQGLIQLSHTYCALGICCLYRRTTS